MGELTNRKLQIRYSILQSVYYLGYCAIFGYATVFLLSFGMNVAWIGIALAVATLSSGILMMNVASFADKHPQIPLKLIMFIDMFIGFLCFVGIFLFSGNVVALLVLFSIGAACYDMMQSLNNSLYGRYSDAGYVINYGLARGIGSFAYAMCSLAMGRLTAATSGRILIYIVICLIIVDLITILTTPKVKINTDKTKVSEPTEKAYSMPEFIKAYPRFLVFCIGIACFFVGFMIVQTYMIQIIERLGGDSSDLGIALAVACLCELLPMVLYKKYVRFLHLSTWIKISAWMVLLKVAGFYFAHNTMGIFLAQAIQAPSFGLYTACVVDFTRSVIAAKDAVKGQALISAALTFGSCLGNLIGGQVLNLYNLDAMILVAIGFELVCALVFTFTISARMSKYSQV